jgi:hypothetical protein
MTGDLHSARQAVFSALDPFGYDASCIRFDWKLPDLESVRRYTQDDKGDPKALPAGHVRELDLLAFADRRRHDWHTSAISVDLQVDGAVSSNGSRQRAKELFQLTAAPTAIVGSATERKADVWFNCHNGMFPAEGVDLAPDALKRVFREHRGAVQRELLANLRDGQRHLFDGHLYARRDELTEFLQRGVSKATWLTTDWGEKEQERDNRAAFSRVALALLAARILEDKGALGDNRGQSSNSRDLLVEAKAKWDTFFDTVVGTDLMRLDHFFLGWQS